MRINTEATNRINQIIYDYTMRVFLSYTKDKKKLVVFIDNTGMSKLSGRPEADNDLLNLEKSVVKISINGTLVHAKRNSNYFIFEINDPNITKQKFDSFFERFSSSQIYINDGDKDYIL